MKNFLRSCIIGFLLFTQAIHAQSVVPQGINYQAIARNAVGNVYINQNVAIKITILSGNSGPVAYSERHTTTTNIFGLFTIKIGSGTPITGVFSDINWETANHYLKVEFDPNGGTTYTDLGAQELLSVPYAFYAASSGSGGTAGPQGPQGEQGPAGPQGAQGPQGPAGPGGGLNCWDTDGDGNQDANEDINNDGLWDALDCRGADGAAGPQGPVGATGQQGPTGATGPAGPQGAQGAQGPAGPGGGLNCWDTDGDGIQDVSEDVNNDGLWNALDCRGADGATGPQGPTGATGAQGPIGLTGAAGPAGAQGPAGVAGPAGAQGVAGPAGAQGPQGATGPQGTQGSEGANGQTILNGTNNPGSGIGTVGDFYLNTSSNILFGPKTAGGWGTGVSLVGPTGPAGATGPQGLQGATGPQGPAGTGGGTLDAAYDFGGAGSGRTITADAGSVTINSNGTGTAGIALNVNQTGTSTAAVGALIGGTGNAINASSTNANNSFATIQATTNSATLNNSAVFGQSTGQARAVTGEIGANAGSDVAVRGNNLRTNGGIGVEGEGYNGVSGLTIRNDGYAIFGENTGVPNVGTGTNNAVGVGGVGGIGVLGQTTNGQLAGVLGQNLNTGVVYNNIGVYGKSETGVGVWGENVDGSFYGVYSNGDLGSAGAKPFMIDHPADPENKYLKHFSIESDEILNYYRGTVLLDGNGKAAVTLPSYFHLINTNFSYQLTSIGAPGPNLYVSKEVENGVFEIAGGQVGQKVSWTLVAQRNDPYVRHYPENIKTEIEKRDGEKGRYLRPELYGKPMDQRIGIPSNRKAGIRK
jgi:hypothetical protein